LAVGPANCRPVSWGTTWRVPLGNQWLRRSPRQTGFLGAGAAGHVIGVRHTRHDANARGQLGTSTPFARRPAPPRASSSLHGRIGYASQGPFVDGGGCLASKQNADSRPLVAVIGLNAP